LYDVFPTTTLNSSRMEPMSRIFSMVSVMGVKIGKGGFVQGFE
jgi:hypothetical protein